MKRPAGIVLIASLLFLVGLRALGGGGEESAPASILQLVVGITSLAAAWALWNRRGDAMRTYWVWVATWLIGGGLVQLLVEGVPLLHVLLWWVFVGAVWIAVGLYIRSALGRTAGGERA